MMRDRRAVRIALQRSTIHLVTARDCLALRPVLQAVHDRSLQSSYGRQLAGVDLEALGVAGRALVEAQPRTFSELGKLLGERWPGRDPQALCNAVRSLVPLVQVPPRGIWGASGQAAHTSAEHWLGLPLSSSADPEELLYDEIEALWAPIAESDDWSLFDRKLASIGEARDAYAIAEL